MIAVSEGYIIVEFAVYGHQMCYCESVVMWESWCEGKKDLYGENTHTHTHTHTHTQLLFL